MISSRAQVTYAAPPIFLLSDNWLQIRKAIIGFFPLRDLVWKPALRPFTRNVQQIEVELVSIDDVKEESSPSTGPTILQKPMVNLFVAFCEDLDAYRNYMKRQIQTWHTMITQRKHQEWIIILVSRPDSRPAGGNFLKTKGNILERLKSDFNVDKQDRCIQVYWSPGDQNSALWEEVKTRISASIVTAFDGAVMQLEDEIKRSESQRQMPGWNFCKFFLLKESLALSFEGLGLLEDTLLQYDELEACFFQVLKEKNLTWFGQLINPDPKDDSLPILSLTKKPYRDLITANSISIFDFRIYLLGHQCELLGRQHKVEEVAKKVLIFLNGFATTLRKGEAALPRFFVESWIYSSALSTVQQCDDWSTKFPERSSSASSLDGIKAELLDLACSQLTKVGNRLCYIPSSNPVTDKPPLTEKAASSDMAVEGTLEHQISQQDLIQAQTDSKAFFEIYRALILRTINLYTKAGRRRAAVRLYSMMAVTDELSKNYETALQSFRSLPDHYGSHHWTCMQAYMLARYLSVLDACGMNHDNAWSTTCLDYLDTLTFCNVEESSLPDYFANMAFDPVTLLHGVSSIGAGSNEVVRSNHSMIAVYPLPSTIRLTPEMEGTSFDMVLENKLTSALTVNHVAVDLKGANNLNLTYSHDNVKLHPGQNVVAVSCSIPSTGIHSYTSCHIALAGLKLDYSQQGKGNDRLADIPLVLVPKDYRSVDFDVLAEPEVQLGGPKRLFLSFLAGKQALSNAAVTIRGPAAITFNHADSRLERDEDTAQLQATKTAIILQSIPPGSDICFSVPYSGSIGDRMGISIALDYRTVAFPDKVRSAHFHKIAEVALPVNVQVQDFFSAGTLLSVFSVTGGTRQPVRIASATLGQLDKSDSGLVIESNQAVKRPCTVSLNESSKYIFKMSADKPRTGAVLSLDTPDSARVQNTEPCRLALSLTVRTVQDEIKYFVKQQIRLEMDNSPPEEDINDFEILDLIIAALTNSNSWFGEYETSKKLVLPPISVGDFRKAAFIDRIAERQRLSRPGLHEIQGSWQIIKIPVDLPCIKVVVTAEIKLNSAESKAAVSTMPVFFAGQPIAGCLWMTFSFLWGDLGEGSCELTYNVDVSRSDWLISGCLRGDIAIKDGETVEIPLALVPLRHGEMLLPLVKVSPLLEPAPRHDILSTFCAVEHGATRIMVHPHRGRSSFVVEVGERANN